MPGILISLSEGVDQQPGVGIRLVIRVGGDGRTDALDLKNVIVFKYPCNVFGYYCICKFLDNKQINPVIVVAKEMFWTEVKEVGVVTQFNLHGADSSLVPIDTVFFHGESLSFVG